MKKSILIGMTAVALSLGACAKRTPPPEVVPPAEQAPPVTDPTDPNSLEVVELPALQADLVAGERDRRRPEGRGHVRGHLRQRFAHDREDGRARHATPADEPDGNRSPAQLLADLRARAVHDDDLVAGLRELERANGCLGGDRTADLQDDEAHVVYSAFRRT